MFLYAEYNKSCSSGQYVVFLKMRQQPGVSTSAPVILSAAKNLSSAARGFFAALRMTGTEDQGFAKTYLCKPLQSPSINTVSRFNNAQYKRFFEKHRITFPQNLTKCCFMW